MRRFIELFFFTILFFLFSSLKLLAQGYGYNSALEANSSDTNIISFSAKYSEGRVYIIAVVNGVKDDRYYIVEKSTDGNTFKAIGNIKCKGTEVETDFMYSYTDEDPVYTYLYYRLIHYTDNNDSVFSKTIGVLAGFDDSNLYVTMEDDIWVMNKKNEKMIPFKLDINTTKTECNAILSSDDGTLYFVSDREGGYGNKDIWACEKLSNGSWSKPYNLGSEINTTADEDYPVLLGDGVTLFFSRKDPQKDKKYSALFSTQGDQGFWCESESVNVLNSERKDYYTVINDTLSDKTCWYHLLKGYDVTDAPPVQSGNNNK